MEKPKRIPTPLFADLRGSFCKPFSAEAWASHIGAFHPKELFFSTSHMNVLRGFHFQRPPSDHAKIVFVLRGRILDVTVDLRKGGGSYGAIESFELGGNNGEALFIPKGFAHAFLSLENETCVGYLVDSVHAPLMDDGIKWSSIDFNWPIEHPVISERDNSFKPFSEFKTPFS